MDEPDLTTSFDADSPAPDEPIVSASGVSTGYGNAQVLDGVDLEVYPEEIVLVFGPNGAGKSTFLKAAYGLLPLWNGGVHMNGYDVARLRTDQMVDHGICYVPQRGNVFPNMTISENLDVGGVTVANPDARKETMYDLFPVLDEYASRQADQLSGGQQQMLAIARALMVDPDVLLIDEPTAGLAPQLVDRLFAHIETIRDTGTTILMVEQNVVAGLESADRGYALRMGENHVDGPADELLADERIQELYLGG